MTQQIIDIFFIKTARAAGVLYLLLAVMSAFGLMYVPSIITLTGDSVTVLNTIIANEWLFRLGIVSNLLTFTLNIFVAVFLYKLLKPVHKEAASLMVMLILVGVTFAMINELNHVALLILVNGVNYSAAFIADYMPILQTLFVRLYEYGFMIAHIFFGLWLFPLGYLVFISKYIPKFIGVLLVIAGFGYLIDFFLFFLFPEVTIKVSEFTFIGEVIFIVWLLMQGLRGNAFRKEISLHGNVK